VSLERIPFSLRLCQAHGGEEGNSCNTVASLKINKPSPLLLEYTFTGQSVPLKNSIQTGFGGMRLKPTVKQPHKVITNLSNHIAVKEYKTHTIAEVNFSIARLPITFGSDGSVHLAFDFAHEVLRLVDLLSMAPREGVWGDWWTVPQLSHHLFAELAAEVECHAFIL